MFENTYDNFINRELSWIEFNQRVLEEAEDNENPLMERVKFLAIVSSNLDEFFMVRVASLLDQVEARFSKPDCAGLTPQQQIEKIFERTHVMANEQYDCLNMLGVLLRENSIEIVKSNELNEKQAIFLDEYFFKKLFIQCLLQW